MRRVACLIALSCLTWTVAIAARSRSVWDGAYTTAQAVRGKAVYEGQCSRCHGDTLLGGDDAKPLVGDAFLNKWSGKTVWELVDLMRRTMPDDGPAVLSRAEAANIAAYLLSANTFPAGSSELASDDTALRDIVITKTKP